ncbi:Conserved_hypothetical protein [Hexamita inflata]|uniref:Uncharacterized protein n=1 Tax=Hexamita inflata TaxID=28002 RepID=A0AA86NIP4_9EUKA|nr:Conserved hypothetical protein [Hexamita inflata]
MCRTRFVKQYGDVIGQLLAEILCTLDYNNVINLQCDLDQICAFTSTIMDWYKQDIQHYRENETQLSEEYKIRFPFLTWISSPLLYHLLKCVLKEQIITINCLQTVGQQIDTELFKNKHLANIKIQKYQIFNNLTNHMSSILLQLLLKIDSDEVLPVFLTYLLKAFKHITTEKNINKATLNTLKQLLDEQLNPIIYNTSLFFGITLNEDQQLQPIEKQTQQLNEKQLEIINLKMQKFQKSCGLVLSNELDDIREMVVQQPFIANQQKLSELTSEIVRIKNLLINILPVNTTFNDYIEGVDNLVFIQGKLTDKLKILKDL